MGIIVLVHRCNAWASQEDAELEGTVDVSMIASWFMVAYNTSGFGIN